MRNIIGWLAALIAGSIGWWLGEFVGFASAMLLSVITSAIGLYYGYRWFDNNLG